MPECSNTSLRLLSKAHLSSAGARLPPRFCVCLSLRRFTFSHTLGKLSKALETLAQADVGDSSMAIHQFWATDTSSSGYPDPKIRVVLKGLQAMLRAQRRLHRLHVDLDQSWADMLEWQIFSEAPDFTVPCVKEAIFGTEVGFMLKYTPNVERLSNLTFMGRCEEAPTGPFRFN